MFLVVVVKEVKPNGRDWGFSLFYNTTARHAWYKHCVKSVRIRSYSGPHFPVFGLNTEKYSLSFHIQPECEKMRTSITPNRDTFYAEKCDTSDTRAVRVQHKQCKCNTSETRATQVRHEWDTSNLSATKVQHKKSLILWMEDRTFLIF